MACLSVAFLDDGVLALKDGQDTGEPGIETVIDRDKTVWIIRQGEGMPRFVTAYPGGCK